MPKQLPLSIEIQASMPRKVNHHI